MDLVQIELVELTLSSKQKTKMSLKMDYQISLSLDFWQINIESNYQITVDLVSFIEHKVIVMTHSIL